MSRNRSSPLWLEFTCARSRGTSPKCSRVPSASAASIDRLVSPMGPERNGGPAAGIVAGHAADGGARGGGNIDRKPQAMFLKLPVEVVEHDPRFDYAGTIFDVKRDDAVQMFGKIDDDAVIDGLAALRRPAAARRDDPAFVTGDAERPQRLVHGPGDHHAERQHLIERGVGRIAAAVERIEVDVAGDIRPEPLFKPREA